PVSEPGGLGVGNGDAAPQFLGSYGAALCKVFKLRVDEHVDAAQEKRCDRFDSADWVPGFQPVFEPLDVRQGDLAVTLNPEQQGLQLAVLVELRCCTEKTVRPIRLRRLGARLPAGNRAPGCA